MTTNSRGGYVRTEQQALLDTEALRLRSSGMTYREIAERQVTDVSTAHRRVARALEAVPYEAVEHHRQVEMERLDNLTAALWPSAMAGNVRAVEMVLKTMDRRAALLGLDAPRRKSVEVITPDLIGAEIRRLEQELGIASN